MEGMTLHRQFLATLRKELKVHGITISKADQQPIMGQFESLIKANLTAQTSRAARKHLQLACIMLAAYRTLDTKINDQELLLHMLGRALSEPNSWVIRHSTRALLFFTQDPMSALVNYTKTRIPSTFGEAFEFTNEGCDEQQYTMRISSCFYHRFFVKNNADVLTPLFCAWDMNWIEPISEEKHGVTFSRETTIASGGGSCPFTFTRTQHSR